MLIQKKIIMDCVRCGIWVNIATVKGGKNNGFDSNWNMVMCIFHIYRNRCISWKSIGVVCKMINVTLADCIRQRTKAEREFKFWDDKIEEAKIGAEKDGWAHWDTEYKGFEKVQCKNCGHFMNDHRTYHGCDMYKCTCEVGM